MFGMPQQPLANIPLPMGGADVPAVAGQPPGVTGAPPVPMGINPDAVQPGAGLAGGFDNPGGAVQVAPKPGETPDQKRRREMLVSILAKQAFTPAQQQQARQVSMALPPRR